MKAGKSSFAWIFEQTVTVACHFRTNMALHTSLINSLIDWTYLCSWACKLIHYLIWLHVSNILTALLNCLIYIFGFSFPHCCLLYQWQNAGNGNVCFCLYIKVIRLCFMNSVSLQHFRSIFVGYLTDLQTEVVYLILCKCFVPTNLF